MSYCGRHPDALSIAWPVIINYELISKLYKEQQGVYS